MDINWFKENLGVVFGGLTLLFSIYIYIKSNIKKLQFKSYKHFNSKGHYCETTITNIGNKPINLRSISIQEKNGKETALKQMSYNTYKDKIEDKPLDPGNWIKLIFKEDKYLSFFDIENNIYKTTRFIIKDSAGKRYKSKWFRQSDLR